MEAAGKALEHSRPIVRQMQLQDAVAKDDVAARRGGGPPAEAQAPDPAEQPFERRCGGPKGNLARPLQGGIRGRAGLGVGNGTWEVATYPLLDGSVPGLVRILP